MGRKRKADQVEALPMAPEPCDAADIRKVVRRSDMVLTRVRRGGAWHCRLIAPDLDLKVRMGGPAMPDRVSVIREAATRAYRFEMYPDPGEFHDNLFGDDGPAPFGVVYRDYRRCRRANIRLREMTSDDDYLLLMEDALARMVAEDVRVAP